MTAYSLRMICPHGHSMASERWPSGAVGNLCLEISRRKNHSLQRSTALAPLSRTPHRQGAISSSCILGSSRESPWRRHPSHRAVPLTIQKVTLSLVRLPTVQHPSGARTQCHSLHLLRLLRQRRQCLCASRELARHQHTQPQASMPFILLFLFAK